MTTPEPLLTLTNAHVHLGTEDVLCGVDMAVQPGQVVTLVGPNGAGKTTLIRAALGLVPLSEGQVSRRPGLRIGYMPQRLFVEDTLPLSVRRFLRLGQPDGDIRSALEDVGALECLDKPFSRLSGGEMQRVLLARALLRQPDLLVLDEPVQGVDISGQIEFYRLIGQIREQRGCGVLMVSHDLHLVMAATDLVICLNRHVCCEGHPSSVSQDPAYHDLFGTSAAATLAVYHHHHDHHHAVDGHVEPATEEDAHG